MRTNAGYDMSRGLAATHGRCQKSFSHAATKAWDGERMIAGYNNLGGRGETLVSL